MVKNGHEICGFYTIDLNDKSLNKVGHGHTEGSRLCIKNKIEVKVLESIFTDPGNDVTMFAEAMESFAEAVGGEKCGANDLQVLEPTAAEAINGEKTILFR